MHGDQFSRLQFGQDQSRHNFGSSKPKVFDLLFLSIAPTPPSTYKAASSKLASINIIALNAQSSICHTRNGKSNNRCWAKFAAQSSPHSELQAAHTSSVHELCCVCVCVQRTFSFDCELLRSAATRDTTTHKQQAVASIPTTHVNKGGERAQRGNTPHSI